MSAPRLHPFWRLFLCATAVIFVTLLAAGVGVGLVIALAPGLHLGTATPDQLKDRLTHDFGLGLTLLAYPPALVVIYLFRTRVDRYSWRSLGFARARAASNFARGALTAFLTLSVLFSLMWVAGALRFNGLSSDVTTHGWPYSLVALGGFFLAFLCVGFMEETAFRGYGLHNLRIWLGWGGAVAVQAVVFALIHLGNAGGDTNALLAAIGALPSLALIAVFFALAYKKTGSLWFPIGFHAAWNFCLGCVFSQPVSAISTFRLFAVEDTGRAFLSGGKFGAEGSFFLIPLILALIYLLARLPDHPRAIANLERPEPSRAPEPVPYSAPVAVETPAEEPRPNRYGARFGSAQGFDADMLRELKQMQDARDEAQRMEEEASRAAARAEELQREERRQAQLAAQAPVAVAEVFDAEPDAPQGVIDAPEPVSAVAEPVAVIPPRPRASLEPRRASPPPPAAIPDAPVTAPTEAPDAPQKKARPRW